MVQDTLPPTTPFTAAPTRNAAMAASAPLAIISRPFHHMKLCSLVILACEAKLGRRARGSRAGLEKQRLASSQLGRARDTRAAHLANAESEQRNHGNSCATPCLDREIDVSKALQRRHHPKRQRPEAREAKSRCQP